MTRARAARLYRYLLTVVPARLRHAHAAEMEALFLDRFDDACLAGRIAVIGLWVTAIADIVTSRLREPFRSRRRLPGQPTERHNVMIGSDLRYTLRWLGRQKSSTALVVVMLSIGIAANIVVFSLVSGLFLKPFPFPSAERLVYINETAPRWNLDVVGINYPDFHQWKQDAKLFDSMTVFDQDSFNLSDERGAERIEGAVVTADFAKTLGVEPILGRMFTADEDRPKAPHVVLIAEGVWRDRFGASPDVLGRTLKLNGVAHTIVGVFPRAAEFPARAKLWVPLAGDSNQQYQSYGYSGIGRMRAGVTTAEAEKDLLRAHGPIWQARDKEKIVSPFAHPLRDEFVQDYRTTARALLGAVSLLLLIACANVASVMLARALGRRREMGIRLAVGASRSRLARQLFLENLIIALVSGIAGLSIGRWALGLLLASAGDQVPSWTSFDLDFRVIAFSLLLVVGTAMLFGSAPATHAMRGNLRGAMHDTSAATTVSPRGRRTLRALVASEFAIAAILLASGGLLWRAFDRVRHVDPGFRPDHVLTFQIALPEARYEDGTAKTLAFWDRLTERFAATPGVEAAGLVSCPPLSCHWGNFYDIEGRPPLKPGEANPVVLYRPASPGYFRAMGIRLKAGRFFDASDVRDSSNRAAIVNETFARTFWPGSGSPIGRRFRGNSPKAPWITVVGYVEDVRHYGLERPMRPGIYLPLSQTIRNVMTVAVRTNGDPTAFTNTARHIVQELDPELPLFRIRTMEDALQRSLADRALYSWLLAVFAGLAFGLALGGSYGVTSYLVSQRTRELGIRVALGARTAHLIHAVLGGSLAVAVVGITLGIVASLATGKLLQTMLFGVSPHDPMVLAGVGAVLVTLAAVASWPPARRALRVDPMKSLRSE